MLHEADRMGGFVHLPRNIFNTFFFVLNICSISRFNYACCDAQKSLHDRYSKPKVFRAWSRKTNEETFLHHQRPSRCSTFSYKWTLEFLPASVVKCQAKTRAAQCIIFSRVFVPTRDKNKTLLSLLLISFLLSENFLRSQELRSIIVLISDIHARLVRGCKSSAGWSYWA